MRSPILAAVLVPILASDAPDVLFVRRATHMRTHAGQVAFPGGKLDPQDASLEAAALREAEEELGIAPSSAEIVHRLPDIFTFNSNFLVTPFLAILAPPFDLRPNSEEIADVHHVPLAAILEPDAVRFGVEHLGGRHIPTWQFDHGEVHVWGATGRMLHDLVGVFADTSIRAAFEGAIERARARVE